MYIYLTDKNLMQRYYNTKCLIHSIIILNKGIISLYFKELLY